MNEYFFSPIDAIFFKIVPRLCSDQIFIELLSKAKVKRIKDNLNEKDRNGGSCP